MSYVWNSGGQALVGAAPPNTNRIPRGAMQAAPQMDAHQPFPLVRNVAVLGGGTATVPQWVDSNGDVLAGAILPAFTDSIYSVGAVATIDLGLIDPSTGPVTSYSYAFQRNGGVGDQTGMTSGSGVTSLTYTWTSLDVSQTVTVVLTPTGPAGAGRPVTTAGATCV
jgi:hypothetical protein